MLPRRAASHADVVRKVFRGWHLRSVTSNTVPQPLNPQLVSPPALLVP